MRILIAGGGTGGHIYPAIAIAQALKRADSSLSVEFVGSSQGLEKKIIPREGYVLHLIPAGPLNGVPKKTIILSLLMLPWGIFKSCLLILKLKPTLILGVGGYASGPMMLAAVLMRRKTTVFEPNAHPGLTNRWLAGFVDVAFVNFEVSKKFFKKSLLLGMPVRKGLNQPAKIPGAGKLKVLIFGGSQGARGINTTVVGAVQKNPSEFNKYEIVHQIGATDWVRFDTEYKKVNPVAIKWFEFLYDMPERYAWADLVICRAGAATLSELGSCSKAAVLIPFPFAADNHQQKNAEALAAEGAAHMIIQKDFTVEKLMEVLDYFDRNRSEIQKYEKAVQKFHIGGASDNIATEILKSARSK